MKPTPQAIENAARAMEEAEFNYHLKLVSLVDDVHTYSLTYNDGSEPLTFDDIDDAYAHIAAKKRQTQAKAALSADLGDMVLVPKEATPEMYAAWMCDHRDWSARYRAMTATARGEE
jgi:hypothetical protein